MRHVPGLSPKTSRPGTGATATDILNYVEELRKSFEHGEVDEVILEADMERKMEELFVDEEEPGANSHDATISEAGSTSSNILVPEIDPERVVDKELLAICQGRVRRRMQLISELRKAYLADVVLLKETIDTYCSEDQAHEIRIRWHSSVPSLDTRRLLWMHAPDETTLAVLPCEMCGGCVEVMHHDSPEIERLTKLVANYDSQGHELKVTIATLRAKVRTCISRTNDCEWLDGLIGLLLFGFFFFNHSWKLLK